MLTKHTFRAALCGCGILLQTSLEAEEGGSGHCLPGSMSSFVDAVPAKETFIARYNLLYYNGDIGANKPLPITGVQTEGAEATSWARGLTLLWRPPIDSSCSTTKTNTTTKHTS
jgi:hypothetical protein